MAQILSRKASTKGGRDGLVKASKSGVSLSMQKPKEMGGEESSKTNPEELFSMGYSSCFASSIEYLLVDQSIEYGEIYVEVDTQLVTDGDAGFKFKVDVYPTIKGLDTDKSDKIIEQAFNFCPYSKAIKDNVDITVHKN